MNGLVVDLFAGGGGASLGLEAAIGRPIDIAINHDEVALAVHAQNHPKTLHLTNDVWKACPLEVTGGRPVAVLWASPDCTGFSRAKGGKPRKQKIRCLAWAVTRWARTVRPRVIFVENVAEFRDWGPLNADGTPNKAKRGNTFRAWKKQLEGLGYVVDHRVLDASLYGAPTRRKRLFIIARCDGLPITWPEPTHGPGRAPCHSAAECIDWSLSCRSIFGRKRPLAEKTMWRIAQGIRRFLLENPRPFIVEMNHSNRPREVVAPLGVITTQHNRFNLVHPVLQQSGYGERKGQRGRVLDIQEPLGTVVAKGQKHALVAAFLARSFGDPNRKSGGGVVIGDAVEKPIATITARDHHSLAAVTLAHFRGTAPNQPGAQPVDAPMPTITAGGIPVTEVRAFLVKYHGGERGHMRGQQLDLPIRTVDTANRFGLVVVDGVEHEIVDIGFRMLEPHELLRAQFGRFAEGYDISAARTKARKVKLIGNSVPPEMAEALVAANLDEEVRRAA